MSGKNRRAKYYGLTAAGRKQLVTETAHWRRMSIAIARIMGTAYEAQEYACSWVRGMAILAMTSQGQDARATL